MSCDLPKTIEILIIIKIIKKTIRKHRCRVHGVPGFSIPGVAELEGALGKDKGPALLYRTISVWDLLVPKRQDSGAGEHGEQKTLWISKADIG